MNEIRIPLSTWIKKDHWSKLFVHIVLNKVAQISFQGLRWVVHNHSLSLDATIMVSKNRPIIGEHIIIFGIIGYHSNSMTS